MDSQYRPMLIITNVNNCLKMQNFFCNARCRWFDNYAGPDCAWGKDKSLWIIPQTDKLCPNFETY